MSINLKTCLIASVLWMCQRREKKKKDSSYISHKRSYALVSPKRPHFYTAWFPRDVQTQAEVVPV